MFAFCLQGVGLSSSICCFMFSLWSCCKHVTGGLDVINLPGECEGILGHVGCHSGPVLTHSMHLRSLLASPPHHLQSLILALAVEPPQVHGCRLPLPPGMLATLTAVLVYPVSNSTVS